MPKGYRHLTYEQRCQIFALKDSHTQKFIADKLSVDPGTISRELRRNSGPAGYFIKPSQELSEARRTKASSRPTKMTAEKIRLVEDALKKKWSPEQIAGRFKEEGIMEISYEWIYQYVRAERSFGGTLYLCLRHHGKKYKKRGFGAGRSLIPNRVDISERPVIVEEKSRLGDFEGDTIIGAGHSGVIVSLVDRKSKFTKLALLNDKSSEGVTTAITDLLKPLSSTLLLTLTLDNGLEFAKHQAIAETLKIAIYFATPYSSWQRGLNEHTNGLVRDYFPKHFRFDTITQAQVKAVEDALNNRPRRSLNYKTPKEVFLSAA